ncbi:MAG: hypothetical protein CSA25_02025 [Desulfobacter postgatei]|uniref:DUF374 domain-containing protein n=1 Tax=Desulfobacter postgatei TaxID=2293 RepID=A0A2G6MSP9_9BACT|nr:MAG: hypothetical protein CSA25_02025 [Desulfobacter postgatei]
MFKRLKFIIYTRPFMLMTYYFIYCYASTFRLKVENEGPWMALVKAKKPVLLVAWHQQFFSAIRYAKTYSQYTPGLMISRSKDGDLISSVANRMGWYTPRGSSSRGGKEALKAMIDHINTYKFGAHILDGPRGPIGKVKAGVIKMALETGAVVVPCYTDADAAWFFNSWDRFMLPKPFTRVWIRYADPIRLELNDNTDFETLRRNLETEMLPGLHTSGHDQ